MKSIIVILTLCLTSADAIAQEPPPVEIVTIGNSITLHAPNTSIGWSGSWGMGASAESKDFSAQLADLLSASIKRASTLKRFNISNFEKDPDNPPPPNVVTTALAADIVVIELGDNVHSASLETFQRQYGDLLGRIHSSSNILLCTSTYWPRPQFSAAIKAACLKAGGIFVNIGEIHTKVSNNAGYLTSATDDVKNHPGDQGMKKIAEAIHQQILQSPLYSRLSSRK
jgi:alpha-galactosidase